MNKLMMGVYAKCLARLKPDEFVLNAIYDSDDDMTFFHSYNEPRIQQIWAFWDRYKIDPQG